MTLTYELDLDILPPDLQAKIQVLMSVRLADRVRRTHTHTQTDGRCQNYYTRHVRDVGCKNIFPYEGKQMIDPRIRYANEPGFTDKFSSMHMPFLM